MRARHLILVALAIALVAWPAAEASISVFISTIYGASSLEGLELMNSSAAIPWIGLGSWRRVELYGPAFINYTVDIEPGDVLIPHLYYLHFNGGKIVWQTSPYLQVNHFTAVSEAAMWQDTIWRNGVATTGTFSFGFAWTRGFYFIYSNGTYTIKNAEYDDVEIRKRVSVGAYYVFGGIAGDTEALARIYLPNGTLYVGATYPYPQDFGDVILEKSGAQLQLAMGLTWEAPKPINLRYLVIYNETRDWGSVEETAFKHVVYQPSFFFDPSLNRGDQYIDYATGMPGSVQSGEVDLEWDNKTWFWVIRGVKNDDYIHFEYMKPGVLVVTNETGHIVLYKIITEENENLTVYLKPGRYTIEYQPFGAPVGTPEASPTAVADNALIGNGTIIAPHTRKFLFDGASYAFYPGFNAIQEYTAISEVMPINISGNGDKDVFGLGVGTYYGSPFGLSIWHGYYAIVFQCELCMPYIPARAGEEALIYMAAKYGGNGTIANLLTGENNTKTNVNWNNVSNGYFYIGADNRGVLRYFNGTISYVAILNKYVNIDNDIVRGVYSSHVIDYRLLYALFDPSFHDSNGVFYVIGRQATGAIVGNAAVIPDNKTWLWVIHGAPLEGVDIRYSRGVYVFEDARGSLYAVPVDWEARAWLPAGNYRVYYYENLSLAGLGYRGVRIAVSSGLSDLRGKTVLLWVYVKAPIDIIVGLEGGDGELLVYPGTSLHPGWNLIIVPSEPRPYPKSYPYPHALLGSYDASNVKSITLLYRGYVELGGLAISSATAIEKVQVLGSGVTLSDVMESLRYENVTEWGIDDRGRQVLVIPAELVVGDGRVYSTLSINNVSLAVYASGTDSIMVMDSAALTVASSTLYIKGGTYALRASSAAYLDLENTTIYAGGSVVLSSALRISNTRIIGGPVSVAIGNAHINGLVVEGDLTLAGDAPEGAVAGVRAYTLTVSPSNSTWLSRVEAGRLVVTGGDVYLVDSPFDLANRTTFNGTGALHLVYTVRLLPSFNAYVEHGYVIAVASDGAQLAEAPIVGGSSVFQVEPLELYYNASNSTLRVLNRNPIQILVYDDTGFLVANITTNITEPLTVSTANGTNYYISLNTWTDKGSYTLGESVIIYAMVNGLQASSINATVEGPNASWGVELHDDGVYPDLEGSDGVWSGLFMGGNVSGKYRVLVEARVGDTIIRGETWFTVENITASQNVTSTGGLSLMSLSIETLHEAALRDGVAMVALVIVALLPLFYRRYPLGHPLFTIFVEAVVIMVSFVLISGRAVITSNAYIVNTANGTTIKPVYQANPFVKLYLVPIELAMAILIIKALDYISERIV